MGLWRLVKCLRECIFRRRPSTFHVREQKLVASTGDLSGSRSLNYLLESTHVRRMEYLWGPSVSWYGGMELILDQLVMEMFEEAAEKPSILEP